jgi:hypothetical protein
MMNIKHRPLFDTKRVCELYSEKDGVPVKYVCTSAPNMGTSSADIFYRETPHPEHGNRYFGLYRNPDPASDGTVMITNADKIEDLDFDMVEVDGELHYSQNRWDYYHVSEDLAIDGGRAYFKMAGDVRNAKVVRLRVKDGEFVEELVDTD